MSTFGRVLGVLGLGLAAAGGIGAMAIMPPSALTHTAEMVEEKRLALRAHLPDMPPLQELMMGTGGSEAGACSAGAATGEASDAAEPCGATAPKVLGRSGGAGKRFQAPAAPTAK